MVADRDTNWAQMNARQAAVLCLAFLILGSESELGGQELQIGIIDFYGLRQVTESEARRVLTIKEGDTISVAGDERPSVLTESERRLSTLPGVRRAHTELVCCDAGRSIIYVGIEEKGAAKLHFRQEPKEPVRLRTDIVQAGEEFSEALWAAVKRDSATEDDSQGHALSQDPAMRAVEERFLVYAARELKGLRRVLRDSSDAKHRALAAQILGYAANKQQVVGDLAYAMSDPSETVRNNAMRALAVFANTAQSSSRTKLRVPYEPFISLLNSPIWTDRNKASLALVSLTAHRDPQLLEKLRREAIAPLVEMARWKSEGHAMPAFLILGRIAGQSDEAAQAQWSRGDRESVITGALECR